MELIKITKKVFESMKNDNLQYGRIQNSDGYHKYLRPKYEVEDMIIAKKEMLENGNITQTEYDEYLAKGELLYSNLGLEKYDDTI